MALRNADATISFYWNERRKVWGVSVSTATDGVATGTARTTEPIGAAEKHLLLKAVIATMEAWLPTS